MHSSRVLSPRGDRFDSIGGFRRLPRSLPATDCSLRSLPAGWLLGIEECLCLVIVSGICVDFVLHIACAFAQALPHAASRDEAAEAALLRMGSPLLAGAATTLGAALSLSCCTFTVLSKIGIFIAFATLWSFVTAQTLLPALLATCRCTPPTRVERQKRECVAVTAASDGPRVRTATIAVESCVESSVELSV